jgi:FkbM family methyltransferase
MGTFIRKFDMTDLTKYYNDIHESGKIPDAHINYLNTIDYSASVVYDIGAAVLHWTREATKKWPTAEFFVFDAVHQLEDFYKEKNVNYFIGVFSDVDDREVNFYNHPIYLGGNSYYKENEEYSPAAKQIYTEEVVEKRRTITIDTIVKTHNLPLPDLVKIDTQGSEIDILNGMTYTLSNVKHLIVELQHVQYNIGANLMDVSIPFIESLGFELSHASESNKYFSGNGPDADYHFIKK